MEAIYIILVPLALLLLFGIGAAIRHRTNKRWRAMGKALGLRFRPGSWFNSARLSGRHAGANVSVSCEQRSTGNSSYPVTVYRYSYRGGPRISLELRSEGFWQKLGKLFGGRDVQVGDRGFDDRVLVRGKRARAITRYLTPERRARIRAMLATDRAAVITHRAITLERRGSDDVRKIRKTLDRMGALVAVLREEPATEPAAIDRAIAAQREGRIADAEQELDDARAGGAEEIEVETLARELAGEPPVEEQDGDPAVDDGSDTEPTPREAVPAVSLDADAVAAALFAPGLTVSDAHAAFEAYRGRDVAWHGKLERVESYFFDRVFGDDPGARAVVEIAEVGGEMTIARTAQAIVQLPRDAAEDLRGVVGERVALRGRLVRCDPFVRNVFVAEGAVTPGG